MTFSFRGLDENVTFHLGTFDAVRGNFAATSGRGSPFHSLERKTMDRAAHKNAMPIFKNPRSNMRGNTVVVFLVVVFMLVVMAGSIYYPYPSGEPMTVGVFLQLWFREAILFVLLIVGLIAAAVSWLRRTMKARHDGKQNAL